MSRGAEPCTSYPNPVRHRMLVTPPVGKSTGPSRMHLGPSAHRHTHKHTHSTPRGVQSWKGLTQPGSLPGGGGFSSWGGNSHGAAGPALCPGSFRGSCCAHRPRWVPEGGGGFVKHSKAPAKAQLRCPLRRGNVSPSDSRAQVC